MIFVFLEFLYPYIATTHLFNELCNSGNHAPVVILIGIEMLELE